MNKQSDSDSIGRRRNRYSAPVLEGEEAERFSELDSKTPTQEQIANLNRAKELYLEQCEIARQIRN
jgi:hypothetical protein